MKNTHALTAVAGLLVAVGMLTVLPGKAEADWFHRGSSRHGRYGSVVVLPRESVRIVVSGSPYYYCRGSYYRPHDRGYVQVPAPVGAVVTTLPQEQQSIVIDGTVYHYYDGVYYKGGPAGYTVVPVYPTGAAGAQNIPIAQSETVVAQPTPASVPATTSSFVINVTNKNGSFTPVTLQLAGNGMYIGPQGEVYTSLPTTAQLQSMYGR